MGLNLGYPWAACSQPFSVRKILKVFVGPVRTSRKEMKCEPVIVSTLRCYKCKMQLLGIDNILLKVENISTFPTPPILYGLLSVLHEVAF